MSSTGRMLPDLEGTAESSCADGSLRAPKRVRPGYVPPEERPVYKAPRPERLRGELLEWRHGYGFIRPDSLGSNLFVHHSNVLSDSMTLQPGDHLEFERCPPDNGEKADRAVNVRLVRELPARASASTAAPPPELAPRATTQSERLPRTATAAMLVPRSVAARGKRHGENAPAAVASVKPRRSSAYSEESVLGHMH
jgi:cold shock CspA family protein